MRKNLAGACILSFLLVLTLLSTSFSLSLSETFPPTVFEFYKGLASASINIPTTGNVSSIMIFGEHIEDGTFGGADELEIDLWSPESESWSVYALVTTYQDPAALAWLRSSINGSTGYMAVDGNVTLNNVFQVSASELKVQLTGSQLTIEFNPVTPPAITLPRDAFSAENYSTTWALPAFNMEFDGYGNLTLDNSSYLQHSGFSITEHYVYQSANATFSSNALNFTTSIEDVYLTPFLILVSKAPT